MKKTIFVLSLLVACVLAVGLSSCSSDDSGDKPTPPQPIVITDIIGTWQCTFSVDNFEGISEQGLMVGKQVTLKEDGTYTTTSPTLGLQGTYTLSGNTITAQSTTGTCTIMVTLIDETMHWSGSTPDGFTFEYKFARTNENAED